jgi:hypothetical protein
MDKKHDFYANKIVQLITVFRASDYPLGIFKLFLAYLDHVLYCHHFVSVMVNIHYLFTIQFIFLKPLAQLEPNLIVMLHAWFFIVLYRFYFIWKFDMAARPILCSDWVNFDNILWKIDLKSNMAPLQD